MRLKFGRKSCLLGELSSSVGWNKGDLVEKLESKRLEKASTFHQAKVDLEKQISQVSAKSNEIQ